MEKDRKSGDLEAGVSTADDVVQPTAETVGLMRASAAAPMFDLSVNAFCASCESGDLPIRLVRIGPRRLRFVRSAEVHEFLSPKVRAASDAAFAVILGDSGHPGGGGGRAQ